MIRLDEVVSASFLRLGNSLMGEAMLNGATTTIRTQVAGLERDRKIRLLRRRTFEVPARRPFDVIHRELVRDLTDVSAMLKGEANGNQSGAGQTE